MKVAKSWYNIIRIPAVLLVRVPIVGLLLALIWLGEKAEDLGFWTDNNLPAFETEKQMQERLKKKSA